MKKLIGFLFWGLAAVQGMAQKLTAGDCNTQVPVREVVRATESLALFFHEIKTGYSDDTWLAFQERAQQSPGLSAFDVFGGRAEEIRNDFTGIATTMEQQMLNYIAVINPSGNRTEAELWSDLKKDMNCFVRDPVQNNLDSLLQGTGFPLPENAQGPCEDALRNCLNTARSEYLSRAWECASLAGGGLLRTLGSGLLKAGMLLLCEAIAGEQHYQAFFSCLSGYGNCRSIQ